MTKIIKEKKGNKFFGIAFSFHGVQNFCHDISNTSSTPLESMIRWMRFVYETDDDCFDFGYDSTVDRYSNTQQPSNYFNGYQVIDHEM